MTDKLDLDRMEALLETMEPEEIRSQYGAALAEAPECERMLHHFEAMDDHLDHLKSVDPAPAMVLPKRRRARSVLTWAVPLAAIVIIAVLVSINRDLIPRPSSEPVMKENNVAFEPRPASPGAAEVDALVRDLEDDVMMEKVADGAPPPKRTLEEAMEEIRENREVAKLTSPPEADPMPAVDASTESEARRQSVASDEPVGRAQIGAGPVEIEEEPAAAEPELQALSGRFRDATATESAPQDPPEKKVAARKPLAPAPRKDVAPAESTVAEPVAQETTEMVVAESELRESLQLKAEETVVVSEAPALNEEAVATVAPSAGASTRSRVEPKPVTVDTPVVSRNEELAKQDDDTDRFAVAKAKSSTAGAAENKQNAEASFERAGDRRDAGRAAAPEADADKPTVEVLTVEAPIPTSKPLVTINKEAWLTVFHSSWSIQNRFPQGLFDRGGSFSWPLVSDAPLDFVGFQREWQALPPSRRPAVTLRVLEQQDDLLRVKLSWSSQESVLIFDFRGKSCVGIRPEP
ncbi:hypothetical protein SCOR_14185 [Sulfidibacter corallicola]|uniref:Uncharacterized protein n=1 Tax=Sulfidibacter corallicola TaxID=2818388 RepID=A0A8A4TLQ5_SULCO|nr:hypothetical protein [Sulfidibacter corallicola]QTD47535.1 hypothetical protein J3U87_18225 [Sulfidibacter corallicola]